MCPLTSIYSTTNKLDSHLNKLFNNLLTIKTSETEKEKTKRKEIENQIKDFLTKKSYSDGEMLQKQAQFSNLCSKGYQLRWSKQKVWILDNRYTIYNMIYPDLFDEYLKKTNEKKITVQFLSSFFQNLIFHFSSFTASDKFQIYDVGIGTGEILSNVLNVIKKTLPRKIKLHAFGVDNQKHFVEKSSKNIENIANKVSIAQGDFCNDISKYTFLNKQLAQHDKLNNVNAILVSHTCYDIRSNFLMEKLVTNIKQLTSKTKNPLICFVHISAENVFTKLFSENNFSFLRSRIKDVNQNLIVPALKAANFSFSQHKFDAKVSFPTLNKKDWEVFSTSILSFNKGDYLKESETIKNCPPKIQTAWKLIIFWSQDTFAAHKKFERKLLIDEFKILVEKYPEGIPVPNTLIAASPNSKLIQFIQSSQKGFQFPNI